MKVDKIIPCICCVHESNSSDWNPMGNILNTHIYNL